MDEQKIEKWVKELIHRASFKHRLEYLPNAFYTLNDREKAEVMRRYKDQMRKFPPRYETKGDRCK